MIKLKIYSAIFYSTLIAIVFLSACTSPRYINSPSAHNAAFLSQRGDFKLSGSATANPFKIFNNLDNEESVDHSYGFDGQAAVAVTNHFMVTASGNYRNEKDKYDDDDMMDTEDNNIVKYNRSMFDVGVGFFTPMGASEKVYFNGVVGVGFGKMSSSDDIQPYEQVRHRTYDANTMKYFLHPSFNFFFNDYLRMSIAPRFSLLKLSNIKTSYAGEEEAVLGYSYARTKTFGLFEPSILLQTGFRNNDWLKLDFGFNFATRPFTSKFKDDSYPDIDTYNLKSRNFLFSLGLSFYPMNRR